MSAMSAEQRSLLQAFEVPEQRRTDDEPASFAERALKKRRAVRVPEVTYVGIDSISTTSNCVERFFSSAKYVLSHHRHRMLPITLEVALFLECCDSESGGEQKQIEGCIDNSL